LSILCNLISLEAYSHSSVPGSSCSNFGLIVVATTAKMGSFTAEVCDGQVLQGWLSWNLESFLRLAWVESLCTDRFENRDLLAPKEAFHLTCYR
jgi:hypothetical protein